MFDHYLTVQLWKPKFDTDKNDLQSFLVWVRIPCLPIEYYDHAFLMRLGAKLGKPVKIDNATSLVSRGHFTRMRIEIDLTKPLVPKFRLHKRTRRIEYEGVHLICFNCGKYGHRKEACPFEVHWGVGDQGGRGDGSVGEESATPTKDQKQREEPIIKPEVTEDYGPWMMALRRLRRSHQRVAGDGNKTNKASRHGEGIQGPNIIENQAGSSHYRRESIFEALVGVDPQIVLDEGDESPMEITNGKGPHTHVPTKNN